MSFFSWTNFWVNRIKAKQREKLIVEVCIYMGIPVLSFYQLPRKDQDYLIDQYKQIKGIT